MILSEEQEMIRDMARSFAHEQLAPNSQKWEKEGVPMSVLDEMGSLGLFGMTVPEEWDGAATDYVSYALAIMEIAQGDGGLSTLMSVTNSPSSACILNCGNDYQKETFLKPLARGEKIGMFCLTESQAGSDASMLKTRAVKVDGGWKINGTKQFITSGNVGKIAIVFAVTNPEVGKKGISAFIVPSETEGFKVTATEEKMGQKSSDTCSLAFDDMIIPSENMLGSEGDGYKIALMNLESGRIGIAAQSVGMAKAAYEYALAYAQERVAFGKPIFQQQAVGFRLAEMATQIEAAEQLVLSAAQRKDAKLPCLKEACMAKLFASEMAERVCSDALQTLGGYGYLSEYPIEKIARDVRVCQIYEGTSDIQKIVISRQIA